MQLMNTCSPRDYFVTAQDGLRLHVREWGPRTSAALPVVCLPGLARTTADFEALAQALATNGQAGRRVLVLGGSRSGKSRHAEQLLAGATPVTYVATAHGDPADAEWTARIERHRTRRITLGRVNGQASTLYMQVWQADAEPTSTQMEAFAATERDSADVLKRWNDFKSTDLPALNRLLRESRVPEVQLEADVHAEEPQTDEE